MATVAGVKVKAKKPRAVSFHSKPTDGPVWDTEQARELPQEEFDHLLRKSMNYYNYHYTQKDLKKYVVEWMRSGGEFSKDEVKRFERSSDRLLSMTACSLVMAHRQGMPFRERHLEFLDTELTRVLDAVTDDEPEEQVKEDKSEAYKPTIQDRLQEKTSELIGEIEGHYDELVTEGKTSFKAYDFLSGNNVVQSQLGKYEALFQARRAELEQAQKKADPQLVEGYRHYKAQDYKRLIAWIDQLLEAVEQYRGVKKATKKARVKKAPSKEKQISKLKYCKEDKTLKLVSVNPAEILGASELWVYNTKTRKLGKYVSAPYKVLGVKGTSIEGFDTDKSVCKTLRKPEEKLKEFAKAGKVQLRKFLEDIRATETKLNGRISVDVLLLKVA